MKKIISLFLLFICVPIGQSTAQLTFPLTKKIDESSFNWIKNNVSAETGFPLSFSVESDKKMKMYQKIGASDSVTGIIERLIVEEGVSIYDTALWQIALLAVDGEENVNKAAIPINAYWNGQLRELNNIRAGYGGGQYFVYNTIFPEAISADLQEFGHRGFIFRILNAHGKYLSKDPLDEKTYFKDFPNWPDIHWEDWKPIAGENAWVVIAAMHVYHKKYFNHLSQKYEGPKEPLEVMLAEELARAAIMLQAENGAVRMSPISTYYFFVEDIKTLDADAVAIELDQRAVISEKVYKDFIKVYGHERAFLDSTYTTWYFNEISTENNLSWYTAFNLLYEITKEQKYFDAKNRIETYLKSVWNNEEYYFYQGAHFIDGAWVPNKDHFATDVQTWGISKLTPKQIDEWFGEGRAFRLWDTSKKYSGVYDPEGRLLGLGYTKENDRVSIEWTVGAIYALHEVAEYYQYSHPQWSELAMQDAVQMRSGIEKYRSQLTAEMSAYSYSSRRGWIPFGWFSHDADVLSLVSTCWVFLYDAGFNPFKLDRSSESGKN
ncbi:MAG: hypothetical protein AB7S78_03940 [Candidatus Omnitrophota bacterium]